MKAAILIDLDGTLVDSVPDLQAALNRMLGEWGRPALDHKAVAGMVGDGTAKLVERALAATGSPLAGDAPFQRFMEFYEADATSRTSLYPGVRGVLELLQDEGHGLAVCTNKPGRATQAVIEGLDIARFFPVVVAGDSLAMKKPDPEPLLLAVHRLGTTVETAVMVGDHRNDLAAARAAEISAIFATYGYSPDLAAEVPPDRRIGRFDELPGVLSRLGLRAHSTRPA